MLGLLISLLDLKLVKNSVASYFSSNSSATDAFINGLTLGSESTGAGTLTEARLTRTYLAQGDYQGIKIFAAEIFGGVVGGNIVGATAKGATTLGAKLTMSLTSGKISSLFGGMQKIIMRLSTKLVNSARKAKPIATSHGYIKQGMDAESIAARAKVTSGETKLYRTGTAGRSNTGEQAQYWSLEHPSTPGYADRYGIDSSNVREANFVEEAVIKQDTDFVTRPAAAWGDAKGGAIEVVVPEGGVTVTKHTSFEN